VLQRTTTLLDGVKDIDMPVSLPEQGRRPLGSAETDVLDQLGAICRGTSG
jgi:hypothetical protein